MAKHFRIQETEPLERVPQVAAQVDEPLERAARDAAQDAPVDLETKLRALEEAEHAIDAAFSTGKAERALITKAARDDAAEAIRMVEEAMEADERADEAGRLSVIAENMGDRAKTKDARKNARDARRKAKYAHKSATKAAKEAYDAIKFSQPGKLGFMRVVQVIYALNIAGTLFALLLTSRDTIVYDSVTIMDWITIVLQGVAFWFFVNSYKAAKPTVVFTAAFGIASYLITSIVGGTITLFGAIYNLSWNVFLIVYFLRSDRVNDVLVNDISSFKPRPQAPEQMRRSGWPFVRNLIIYFIVFSVLGHWMEAGMCQFIRLGWVQGEYDPTNTMLWRDWLYPYPMEGAAVVIIALVLYPLWQYLLRRFEGKPIAAYVISFFANALTCSIIEFSMGLFVNADHQLWDYSDMFGNIMGQVCLQNAMAFGVAASLIAWVVYPMMERWLSRIPADTMNIAFVIIAIIGGILWSLYLVDPPQNHKADAADEALRLVEEERDKLQEQLVATSFDILTLEDRLNASQGLSDQDRAAIQQEVDKLMTQLHEVEAAIEGKSLDEAA